MLKELDIFTIYDYTLKANIVFMNTLKIDSYTDINTSVISKIKKYIALQSMKQPIYRSSLIDKIYRMKNKYLFDNLYIAKNTNDYTNLSTSNSYILYNSYNSYSSYSSYASFSSYNSYRSYSNYSSFYKKNNNIVENNDVITYKKNIGYPIHNFINDSRYINYDKILNSYINEDDFVTGYGLELI